MRIYERFAHKDAAIRFCCTRGDLIRAELVRQRTLLERYILLHPEFASTLVPLEPRDEAPEIARCMARAAALAGVGPMAAVAGAMAEACARAALAGGAAEAVVENGGDLYLVSPRDVVVGLFAGDHPLSCNLALRVPPERMPLSICSSSGFLGHSLSLGKCDLATVVSSDAALADAAATLAANLVKSPEDVEPALERVRGIPGVLGVLVVKDRRVGLAGDFPGLIRVRDPGFLEKITGDFRKPDSSGDDGELPEPPGGFHLSG